jgi:hypothetical protein
VSPKDVGISGMHVPLCVAITGVLLFALIGSLWIRNRARRKVKQLGPIEPNQRSARPGIEQTGRAQ